MITTKKKLEKKPNSIERFILYFVIGAFFYPSGINYLFPKITILNKISVWMSTLIIFIYIVYRVHNRYIRIEKNLFILVLYFVYIIGITIIKQKGMHTGIQQLVVFPIIILFYLLLFNRFPLWGINALINVLTVLFIVHLFTLKYFLDHFFHLTFLGHPQLLAQMSIVAIMAATSNLYLKNNYRRKSELLILLAYVVMFTSDTSTGIIVAIVSITLWLFNKSKYLRVLWANTNVLVASLFLINFIIMFLSATEKYEMLNFNSRGYIWGQGLTIFKEHPFTGYGIDGFLIEPYWLANEEVKGFSYAHNQILQNLLDGGIVGLFLFWLMIFIVASYIQKMKATSCYEMENIMMVCCLLTMFAESITIYPYIYIVFAIIVSLPKIAENLALKESNDGTATDIQ